MVDVSANMNAFSSDQMLLPSINSVLSGLPFNQQFFEDELMAQCLSNLHTDTAMMSTTTTKPKMLTPPSSPVLSELMPPTDLLKLPPHNGNQMVPNLDLESGFGFLHLIPPELIQMDPETILSQTQDEELFPPDDCDQNWSPYMIISDQEDTSDHSPPTPTTPFDTLTNYHMPEESLTIDSILIPHDPTQPDRRNSTYMSTEESDSGSDYGSCPSPSTPFHSHHIVTDLEKKTHNYKVKTVKKNVVDLKGVGLKQDGTPERRKRGRPRKRLPGELGDRDACTGRRKSGRKAVKGSHLWEFILNILKNEEYCPQYIKWEDKGEGVFRIVNSKVVASMWGDIKNNPRMTYEKLSRAMRYYYKRQILERVDKARLVYKFGEKAEGWREVVADE